MRGTVREGRETGGGASKKGTVWGTVEGGGGGGGKGRRNIREGAGGRKEWYQEKWRKTVGKRHQIWGFYSDLQEM